MRVQINDRPFRKINLCYYITKLLIIFFANKLLIILSRENMYGYIVQNIFSAFSASSVIDSLSNENAEFWCIANVVTTDSTFFVAVENLWIVRSLRHNSDLRIDSVSDLWPLQFANLILLFLPIPMIPATANDRSSATSTAPASAAAAAVSAASTPNHHTLLLP